MEIEDDKSWGRRLDADQGGNVTDEEPTTSFGRFLQRNKRVIAVLSAFVVIGSVFTIVAVVVYYAHGIVQEKVDELREYAPVDVEDPESGHRETNLYRGGFSGRRR